MCALFVMPSISVQAASANCLIQCGDLLTSAAPGHGMKVREAAQVSGAILGKALSRLESGRGLVLVLAALQ